MPAAHGVHDTAPAPEYDPAAQSAQLDPAELPYLPAPQLTHAPAPADEVLPASQAVHALLPVPVA